MKHRITEAPILTIPDENKKKRLFCDASHRCVGGVILQESTMGKWNIIAYYSRTLSKAQQKWAVIKKEFYAITVALKKYRDILLPSGEFEIYTDHKPLTKINELKCIKSIAVTSCAIFLSEFDFKLIHIPGKSNKLADTLSRLEHIPRN